MQGVQRPFFRKERSQQRSRGVAETLSQRSQMWVCGQASMTIVYFFAGGASGNCGPS